MLTHKTLSSTVLIEGLLGPQAKALGEKDEAQQASWNQLL
jgi:hypothetical protein